MLRFSTVLFSCSQRPDRLHRPKKAELFREERGASAGVSARPGSSVPNITALPAVGSTMRKGVTAGAGGDLGEDSSKLRAQEAGAARGRLPCSTGGCAKRH